MQNNLHIVMFVHVGHYFVIVVNYTLMFKMFFILLTPAHVSKKPHKTDLEYMWLMVKSKN